MSDTRTQTCPAALNIRGEHFNCDWPTYPHDGLGHTNADAQAIWIDDRTTAVGHQAEPS